MVGIWGRGIPGGPYGPGLIDLGVTCRIPGAWVRAAVGNCPGDMGRCGNGAAGDPPIPGRAGDVERAGDIGLAKGPG